MATTTIRVRAATHARLRRLAAEEVRPIGQVIDALLDDYEKRMFFARLTEDFARLRAGPVAWADYEAEQTAWEATLSDGLEEDPWPEQVGERTATSIVARSG